MVKSNAFLVIIAVLGALLFLAAPAMADWDEGDGHKMHFPQLPDPTGWDVAYSDSWLADDWRCSETGPVSDVHFWLSFNGWSFDYVPESMSHATVRLQIWSDDPLGGGNYSTPKTKLWEQDFALGDYTIRYYGSGQQGWYDTMTGQMYPDDHTSYFQINIDKIDMPLTQTEGEIYWLATKVAGVLGENQPGWKTADVDRYPEPFTGEHYIDDGVFFYDTWHELVIDGESRDLAFVITPEPGTFVLLGMAGVGALFFFWRKRRAG